MSILQTILSRQNKGPLAVPTPEWPELDGQLAVRKLPPRERAAFYELARTERPEPGIQFQALMAVYCTVVRGPLPEGTLPQRAFGDNEWKALSADPGSGSAIERLAEAADEANVLSDGQRESLKKKYETTPDSDSNSTSPEATESR